MCWCGNNSEKFILQRWFRSDDPGNTCECDLWFLWYTRFCIMPNGLLTLCSSAVISFGFCLNSNRAVLLILWLWTYFVLGFHQWIILQWIFMSFVVLALYSQSSHWNCSNFPCTSLRWIFILLLAWVSYSQSSHFSNPMLACSFLMWALNWCVLRLT